MYTNHSSSIPVRMPGYQAKGRKGKDIKQESICRLHWFLNNSQAAYSHGNYNANTVAQLVFPTTEQGIIIFLPFMIQEMVELVIL